MSTQSPKVRSPHERVFTVLALLLPVLFFVVLEGGLRLWGYGDDYPLFVPVDGFEDYLYPNPDVARRYFSQLESVPSIPFSAFRRTKDRSTIRLFVQGGSSAAGYPYYFGGGFSDMLEQRLLQTFPGRSVEVVNTAMAAVNSYTLLDFADEIIDQGPDAVIIYAGHNEYYGALGAASTESIGGWRPTVLLYLKLRRWRAVQLIRDLLAQVMGLFGGRKKGEMPGATIMARMVGEQSVPFRSKTFDEGVTQFRANIRDLVRKYRKADVPVFLATVVSNVRDHPPFISGISEATDSQQWDVDFEGAILAASSGDTATALIELDALLSRDDLSADTWFAKAKLLEGEGLVEEARQAYYNAKDRDELRFRAPEAINDAIRGLAAGDGVTLVDVQAAFERASPLGIPGRSLMTEHLHPNIDGFFEIADAFYGALTERQLLGGWSKPVPKDIARGQLLVTVIDSLIGAYRVQVLKDSWPFKSVGESSKPLEFTPATVPESLAVRVYKKEISRYEALEALRIWYLSRGDGPNALKASLAMIQRYPFLTKPYLEAADIYVAQGALDPALAYYEAANDRDEKPYATRMIGGILLRQGKTAESIPFLERAVELESDNVQALYNLAGAYALTAQYEKSREVIRKLIELQPDHADAKRLLDSLPKP